MPKLIAAVAIAAAAIFSGSGVASAEPAQQGEVPCGILIPAEVSGEPAVLFTQGHFVVAPNGAGVLVCSGSITGTGAILQRGGVIEGLPCDILPTPVGSTTNSRTVFSASGEVTLICIVKPTG
jgi:hypothetical protein